MGKSRKFKNGKGRGGRTEVHIKRRIELRQWKLFEMKNGGGTSRGITGDAKVYK